MVEQVLPNIYKLAIPLPKNPLKAINSYVITAKERNLIIDTGMNRPECLAAMEAGLAELNIDLAKTDFFLSHLHADHSGLIGILKADIAEIFASRSDGAIINSMGLETVHWDKMAEHAKLSGFPADELEKALKNHPGARFSNRHMINFTYIGEGDRLSIGEYEFTVLVTPGHTAGHLCLYEPNRKILFSGDHLLGDITPNISQWTDEETCLADYFASLDRIYHLDINIVLPGHRRVFADHRRRIEELRRHHAERLQEVIDILASDSFNAYEVASRMTWDLTYEDWQLFPPPQKWFATGEAIAHLRYLEDKKIIERQWQTGTINFKLCYESDGNLSAAIS